MIPRRRFQELFQGGKSGAHIALQLCNEGYSIREVERLLRGAHFVTRSYCSSLLDKQIQLLSVSDAPLMQPDISQIQRAVEKADSDGLSRELEILKSQTVVGQNIRFHVVDWVEKQIIV